MRRRRRSPRLWIEVACCTVSALVAGMTLVWHDWAETIFHIDPDEGNGSFEVAVTVVAIALTIALALAARLEWRRLAPAGSG